jgi:hypothetical protein
LARRLGRPHEVWLLAASAGAWAVSLALAVLMTNAWYDWTNTLATGLMAALGSFPLFFAIRKSV